MVNKVSPPSSLYRRRIVLELTNISFVFEALDLDKTDGRSLVLTETTNSMNGQHSISAVLRPHIGFFA